MKKIFNRECVSYSVRNLAILRDANTDLLRLTNQSKTCIKYVRGQKLFSEGSNIEGVYVISFGVVKLYKSGYREKQSILSLATTGE